MNDSHQGLRHLLLSFPDVQVEYDGREVVDNLVEAAIHQARANSRGSTNIFGVGEVVRSIADMTGLTYEQAEVIASFERLAGKGHLRFTNPTKTGIIFSETRVADLDRQLTEAATRFADVRTQWLSQVGSTYDLSPAQLDLVWDGTEEFVARVMNKHAAEAAAFLYASDNDGQARFSRSLEEELPQVADCVDREVAEVCTDVCPRFFDSPTHARRAYISNRLQASFYHHLLSLDPGGSELVRDNVQGKVLYLDTNFIYRLLGVQGPAYTFGPGCTLDVATQLRCDLVVAEETINEFLRSLRAEVGHFRGQPIRHDVYRRILAEHPSDQWSFMRLFYQEYLGGRVSNIGEFERKYTHVQSLLEEWGIKVDEEAVLSDEARARPAFTDAFNELSRWVGGERHPQLIAHDVLLLERVRELRGDTDPSPGRIKFWILTYDQRLTRFAIYHATANQNTPVMLADDWLQITRPFLPRTGAYEEAFTSLLRHPLVYQESSMVPLQHVVDALERLDKYEALPKRVAAAMVADGEFLRRLQRAPTEEEKREVLELKVGEVAARVDEANEELQTRVGNLEREVAAADARAQEAAAAKSAAEERRQSLQAQASDLKSQVDALHEGVRGLESYAQGLESRLRWFACAFVTVGIAVAVTGVLWWQAPKLTLSKLVVVAAWTITAETFALAIPLRWRVMRVWAILTGLLTLAAFSLALW